MSFICFFNIRLATSITLHSSSSLSMDDFLLYVCLLMSFQNTCVMGYGNFLLFLTWCVLAQACWVTCDGTSQYSFKLMYHRTCLTCLFPLYQRMHMLHFQVLLVMAEFLLALAVASTFYFQLHCHTWFYSICTSCMVLWALKSMVHSKVLHLLCNRVTSVMVFFSAAHRPLAVVVYICFHTFFFILRPQKSC